MANICTTHVLPTYTRCNLKHLYQINSETWIFFFFRSQEMFMGHLKGLCYEKILFETFKIEVWRFACFFENNITGLRHRGQCRRYLHSNILNLIWCPGSGLGSAVLSGSLKKREGRELWGNKKSRKQSALIEKVLKDLHLPKIFLSHHAIPFNKEYKLKAQQSFNGHYLEKGEPFCGAFLFWDALSVLICVPDTWRFDSDPALRICTTRLLIQLLSLMAFKMPTKNKFVTSFLLIVTLGCYIYISL